jgi:hypothetical protein
VSTLHVRPVGIVLWLVWVALLIGTQARAQPAEVQLSEEEAAAKQSENPISNTVHLTAEDSASYLIGAQDRTQNVLTLTPILPVDVSHGLALFSIARVPLVWAPDVTRPEGGTFGLGDISLNLLLGPKPRSILFWSVGLGLQLPTASNRRLGPFDSGQFSLGPAATVVITPGHAVLGFTVRNVWSVAGRDGAADVSSFLLQPLLNYNLPQAWYLTSSPFILADWTAADDKWLVPVGGGIGKVALLPPMAAVAFEAHAYWNAVRPDLGPPWSLRFQMTVVFPR